jgi:hypothetical protein
MKTLLATSLVLSIVVNIYFGIKCFKQPSFPNAGIMTNGDLFTATNITDSTGAIEYIVAFKNGKYWWTLDGNVVSMNVGIHQGATLRLDETTGRLKSTTIDMIDSNGIACSVTDMNADGIPDKKQVAGQATNWQVFFGGEFVPSFTKGGNRYINQSGTSVTIRFNGTHWAIAE